MLQYCHVFMLPTFKAYTCQQYVCVLSAILAANGQTWHEYALTAMNSPIWLIKVLKIVTPYFKLLRQNALILFSLYRLHYIIV